MEQINNGESLGVIRAKLNSNFSEVTPDTTIIQNSTKPVTGGAVHAALATKVNTNGSDRLITQAEATKLANTSGTNTGDETDSTIRAKLGVTTLSGSNTGDQDLSGYSTTSALTAGLALKRDIASTFLSGGTITFEKDKTYNTYDAPFGGTLSYDLTNAVAGVRATVYFNGSAVPAPAVEEGGNLLAVGQVNKLVFTYLGNNRIVYQITSLNRGTTTDIKLIATGTTTTSTTLGDVGGLSTTLPLNSKFIVEAELMIMCNGGGGVGFAAVFPTLTGINYLLMDGATTNTTYGRQPMSATVGTTKFAAVASATRFPVRIMGYVETTTDGAFKIQFNSTTAGQESTVFIGSWVRFTKVG